MFSLISYIYYEFLGFSFKIALGVGNELVEPNIMPDKSLDGERLTRLFSQRIVWLVPSINLQVSMNTICHKCDYSGIL